ncbi:hypothetical protein EK904_002723 [Melospiza melodia maxima]|nr:hypothetical protein EK904_002723 [Melospiza melodia maxima]
MEKGEKPSCTWCWVLAFSFGVCNLWLLLAVLKLEICNHEKIAFALVTVTGCCCQSLITMLSSNYEYVFPKAGNFGLEKIVDHIADDEIMD